MQSRKILLLSDGSRIFSVLDRFLYGARLSNHYHQQRRGGAEGGAAPVIPAW